MTLKELFVSLYSLLVENRLGVLLGCAAWPVVGTLLALIGRGGASDRDGKLVGNLVITGAILLVLFEVVGLTIGRLMGAPLLQADVLLLVGPPLCLAGSLVGIRRVFPLNQLASIQTAFDVGAFLLLCGGAIWLLSRFRGWGIVFFGSLPEMIAIGLLAWGLGKRLYSRAFGRPSATP